MTPREASEIIGCSLAHVRNLIVSGKLEAKKVATVNNQHGYVYEISKREVDRFSKVKQDKGWPRGKSRANEKKATRLAKSAKMKRED